MTAKDHLLDIWADDHDLAAQGITYLLHIGMNQIKAHTKQDYEAVLLMDGKSEAEIEHHVKVFGFAKQLTELDARDFLDFMAVAAGWASLEDIRPEPGLQLKPDFSDADKVRAALKENLEQRP